MTDADHPPSSALTANVASTDLQVIMKTDKLIEQLELYSNAVVGFMVAQSITFAFTFGTNAAFGCEITRYKLLAAALIGHFVVSTALAIWCTRAICERMLGLSKENEVPSSALCTDTLRRVFRGKAVVVVLFALIPVGLLLFFGLFGQLGAGRCQA